MNGQEQSYRSVVPAKPANKAGQPAAELVAERDLAKGNPPQARHVPGSEPELGMGVPYPASVNSALERVRQAAARDKEVRFTSLLHHSYSLDMLREAYFGLKREAAPGVDGETWRHDGEDLEANWQDLSARLARGAYQARPVQRAYIPKVDGRQRPIGVPVLEDKIVQRAGVGVLNAIYETAFLGFSYGFRPGRGQHDALYALDEAIMTKKVGWVLDAAIRGFFEAISHEWLVKFVEHRIGDKRVVRLIQKWLKAGVLEDGVWTQMEEGTPQGGNASPLLANIDLHYVFDLWVQQWRKKRARGEVIVVRYADDFSVGFQYQSDAERFLEALQERFQKFSLELHPEKTRLMEFGRYAAENRKRRGLGKPATFDFLGFTHACGKTRKGRFTVKRRTMRKRLRAKLHAVKAELWRHLHSPVPEVGKWLRSVLSGQFRYYGMAGNIRALQLFRYQVTLRWRRALKRRSQKSRVTWDRVARLIARWLPQPRIYHPYRPMRQLRLDVTT